MQPDSINKQPAISKKSAMPGSDDILRQLAFENSVQPNIITIVNTGRIIMANKAAAKLLGYPIAELLTKSRSGIFAIEEKNFKKMLRERSADGHSTAQVTAITRLGKELQCEITSAVFAGKDRVKKAITTITDISTRLLKQKRAELKKEKAADAKSDAKIAVNNEWIKYIAKASYDVMWDWDVLSGEVYVGDSVRETFGYNIKNNSIRYAQFLHCLLPEDKIIFKNKMARSVNSAAKSWKNACVLRCFDGSLAASISRASVIRDENGRVVRLIGATQNVTALQMLGKKLQEQTRKQKANTERFNLAAKLSYDVIWEWDISANKFFLGDGMEELCGTAGSVFGTTAIDWTVFVHPEDKALVKKEIAAALDSAALNWEFAHRIAKGENAVVYVFNKASITRDNTGKACRMIGVIHDLSLKMEMQEKLELEIKIKEKQIEEAIEDAKDAARTVMAKELHDNVNQLLAASAIFIKMAKEGGPNSKVYLDRSAEYTMMAVEDIRKLTRGITSEIITGIGLCAAIENTVIDIRKMSAMQVNFEPDQMIEPPVDDKFKLNIFRIVQEQLNNILKHAQAKTVDIHLTTTNNTVMLQVKDDGVGFDMNVKQQGVGIGNIKNRAATYNGTASFISSPGNGCELNVAVPVAGLHTG